MLQIYHSNRVEHLANLLSIKIKQSELGSDPFQKSLVLVQSPGMANWLKCQIATHNTIAANIEFKMPSSWFWSLFKRLNESGSVDDESEFSKSRLTWHIFRALPSLLAGNEFQALQHYLQDCSYNSLKYFILCQHIADAFDHYLVYRPDWIKQWSAGERLAPIEAESQWQMILWQSVQQQIASTDGNHFHRIELTDQLKQLLSSTRKEKLQLPATLCIFGITHLPIQQWEIIHALGQVMDVNVFQFNPCEQYWADIINQQQLSKAEFKAATQQVALEEWHFDQGNPLLSAWGKAGQENFEILMQLDSTVNEYYEANTESSILHHIQNDILQLRPGEEYPEPDTKRLMYNEDNSLSFHACHSRLREVEVAYDHIIRLLDTEPDLKPSDILVMMPDIEDYSAIIDAVFSNQAASQRIPFSISDTTDIKHQPLVTVFLKVLGLKHSRFSFDDVIEMMSYPFCHCSFGMNEAEFEQMRLWLHKANARWALDDKQKLDWNLPNDRKNTWTFAIRRLMLGLCYLDDSHAFGKDIPLASVDGEYISAIGKFIRYIQQLEHIYTYYQEARSLSSWVHFIKQSILSLLTPQSEKEQQALDFILTCNDRLTLDSQQALRDAPHDDNNAVDIEVIAHYFEQQCLDHANSTSFFTGKLNFCTLLPMRSIPFKHICLLGMNEGEYPRTIQPASFDLVAKHGRRLGDRSRRYDDQFQFLEAVMSARKSLYISYIGRCQKDNHQKFPSVVVKDLMEYCTEHFRLMDNDLTLETHLLVEHYLQPSNANYFSSRYLENAKPRYYSYQNQWLAANNRPTPAVQGTEQPASTVSQQSSAQPVTLMDIKRFFVHPVRHYLKNRFGINFSSGYHLPQEHEPVQISALEKYQYLDALVTQNTTNSQHSEYLSQAQLKGEFPDGIIGNFYAKNLTASSQHFIDRLKALGYHKGDTVELHWENAHYWVKGYLNQYCKEGYLQYTVGRPNGKKIVSLWLDHLLACANGKGRPSLLLSQEKRVLRLEPVKPEDAKAHLDTLLDILKQGSRTAIPLPANTSYACFPHLDTPAQASKVFNNHWHTQTEHSHGEGDDLYWQRSFPVLNVENEAFRQLTIAVFSPIYHAMDGQ